MLFELIVSVLYLFLIAIFFVLMAVASLVLPLGLAFLIIKVVGYIINLIIK